MGNFEVNIEWERGVWWWWRQCDWKIILEMEWTDIAFNNETK